MIKIKKKKPFVHAYTVNNVNYIKINSCIYLEHTCANAILKNLSSDCCLSSLVTARASKFFSRTSFCMPLILTFGPRSQCSRSLTNSFRLCSSSNFNIKSYSLLTSISAYWRLRSEETEKRRFFHELISMVRYFFLPSSLCTCICFPSQSVTWTRRVPPFGPHHSAAEISFTILGSWKTNLYFYNHIIIVYIDWHDLNRSFVFYYFPLKTKLV